MKGSENEGGLKLPQLTFVGPDEEGLLRTGKVISMFHL